MQFTKVQVCIDIQYSYNIHKHIIYLDYLYPYLISLPCRVQFVDMSSIFQKFTGTISSMRKHFCSKEKFPLSFDGEYDLTYVGHTRYDKEGDF